MAKNPVGFQVTDAAAGWSGADFDDLFIRKDCFLEGGLWMWGGNVTGELATNNTTNRSSPVQTISGGNNWKEVHPTINFTLAVKTDGTLWGWGLTTALGIPFDANLISTSSPVQTVSGGTDWKTAAAGRDNSAGIKTDGTLWTWGYGNGGMLGDNTNVSKRSPVQTALGGNNWKSISLSAFAAAAIKTDGTLWIWGCNLSGQLGDNTVISKSTPVQTFSGGTNWKQVSAGNAHNAAIKTDGTLWVWGQATYGQIGDGTVLFRSTPIQTLSGGTNWKSVDAGAHHNLAIKTDGTLWTWGRNNHGQLGDQTLVNKSAPVQTITGGTNWRQVSSAFFGGAGIKTDGTLWLWGCGAQGQLGTNSTVSRSSPTQTVTGGTSWSLVDQHLSASITGAIRRDCW